MRSWLHRFWPEVAWAVFAAANVLAMLQATVGQTVPFHFIWISLTVLYGYRTWSPAWTAAVLTVVCLVTGAALLDDVRGAGLDPAELAEVPLMAAVFLAMVWHARRRQAAMAQVSRYAGEQERLREKERQFLRDASHLLRTPVTIARGYTELIHGSADDDATRADAEVVLRELDSVSRISSRLLLLTATEVSELLDTSVFDLADVLVRARQRWAPTTSRTLRAETESCTVRGDAALLESAVDALVENALKHTAPDGTVTMSARCRGDEVEIRIRDDGSGIDPGRLDTLFDRRWRPNYADERSGTGLGLAIVKAIVEGHGGRVDVSSRPGNGTEVTLEFPAFSDQPVPVLPPT